MTATSSPQPVVPLYDLMSRLPGGTMVIPLILGSLIGTFAPDALAIGSFTTALFKTSAGPLIALLIFSTGMQITLRNSGPVLAHTGTVLLCKTILPALLVTLLGFMIGKDGIAGVSLLALLTIVANSNGGIWLAFTGKYGDYRDRGAYIASAVNDGPFFVLLFLGVSGLADIPFMVMLAAVIPFFAFALGTGINLKAIVTGGASGLIIGTICCLLTGFMVYTGYRWLLRRGNQSGIGFAAGTTAGNAIITPEIVAQADPAMQPYVQTATAQVAAAVLVSAILAPLVAAWVLKRQGGLKEQ